MAANDTERYKSEMQDYNTRQESKMRNELKNPPAGYPGMHSVPGSMDRGAPPPYPDMRNPYMYGGSAGYEPAYGMGGPPGGMGGYGAYDFSGYGMGMGGYNDSMSYGGGYGPPIDGPPGSYGAGGGSYPMGMMGGGYQIAYDQYGQPMDGGPPGGPSPYSSYPPPPHGGSWGQG